MKKRIAILASGSGTNAENICQYFSGSTTVEVALILSNNTNAYVLKRANKIGIEHTVFDRDSFRSDLGVVQQLISEKIDLIVLAGFLWLVPDVILNRFPDRIINIHPALLPAFGGKGMYGDRVHRAVLENGEWQSGITIHLVNQKYDEGRILFQQSCIVNSSDDVDDLALKIHALEYEYFPKIIDRYIQNHFVL